MGKSKLWTKEYILALVLNFGVSLGCYLLLSVITIYTKELTGSDVYAGITVGAFSLSALVIRLFAGSAIDKIGSKKLLLLGLIVIGLSSVGYFFTKDITLLIITRIINGLGYGIATTAAATLATDVTPEDCLLDGVNYLGIGMVLPIAVGPPIALGIIGEKYNHFFALFLMLLVVTISLIVLLLFMPGVKRKVVKKSKMMARGLKNLNKTGYIMCFCTFLISLVLCTVVSFITLHAISQGISGISMFFTVYAIFTLLSKFVMSRILTAVGEKKAFLISATFLIGVFLIISFAKQLPVLLFAAAIYGFIGGIISPIAQIGVLNGTSAENRGMANALYYASMDIGFGCGSIIWGWIAMGYGYASIFIVAAGISILIGLSYIYANKLRRA